MEVKNFNPISVLYFTKQVTLAGLQELVRSKAREIYRDAIDSNLEITGPVYWIYYGMDGNPETLFDLEIAIPVTKSNHYAGGFQLKKLKPFKCVSALHKGSWSNLPAVYGHLFGEMGKLNYVPSGECREVYYYIDFSEAINNLTDVQVGIQ